jgi:hypothetical protein
LIDIVAIVAIGAEGVGVGVDDASALVLTLRRDDFLRASCFGLFAPPPLVLLPVLMAVAVALYDTFFGSNSGTGDT